MTEKDAFRAKVVAAVRERLKHEPWFQGACMDSIDEYFPNHLEEAIEQAVLDTVYYDAPNSGM